MTTGEARSLIQPWVRWAETPSVKNSDAPVASSEHGHYNDARSRQPDPPSMFGKPKNPEEHRYYLLPGQGRGARRKHRQQLVIAVVAGLVISALLATALWFLNTRR